MAMPSSNVDIPDNVAEVEHRSSPFVQKHRTKTTSNVFKNRDFYSVTRSTWHTRSMLPSSEVSPSFRTAAASSSSSRRKSVFGNSAELLPVYPCVKMDTDNYKRGKRIKIRDRRRKKPEHHNTIRYTEVRERRTESLNN